MPFELSIALRYLLAKRKQAFISLISLISMIGVAVGVTALIIALALMTGIQGELRDRLLGSQPHIYVFKQGGITNYQDDVRKLRGVPGVSGAAPAVLGKALLRAGSEEPAFITLKGIDPAHEAQVTDLGRSMVKGRVDDLAAPSGDRVPGILIGSDLAAQLHVTVGEDVLLITPQGTLSPMGMIPRSRRFRVAGIFKMGLYDIDTTFAFVTLPVAENLLDRDQPEFIELRVADVYRAPEIANEIPQRLGSAYLTQDWSEINRSLFSALWLEKMAISITIGLIVCVAALNIIASLVLLVMEKSRDIAILKTMGASSRSITIVFMLQGLIIGLVGTLVGATAGLSLSYVLDRYQLIHVPTDVYQVSHVPFKVLPLDFTIVVSAAVVICFLATLYPSRQAAKLDPVQALRFE